MNFIIIDWNRFDYKLRRKKKSQFPWIFRCFCSIRTGNMCLKTCREKRENREHENKKKKNDSILRPMRFCHVQRNELWMIDRHCAHRFHLNTLNSIKKIKTKNIKMCNYYFVHAYIICRFQTVLLRGLWSHIFEQIWKYFKAKKLDYARIYSLWNNVTQRNNVMSNHMQPHWQCELVLKDKTFDIPSRDFVFSVSFCRSLFFRYGSGEIVVYIFFFTIEGIQVQVSVESSFFAQAICFHF